MGDPMPYHKPEQAEKSWIDAEVEIKWRALQLKIV